MNSAVVSRARELYQAGNLPALDEIPCTCKAPRDAHSGGAHRGGVPGTKCRRFRPDPVMLVAVRAAAGSRASFREDLVEHSRRTRAKTKKKTPGTVNVRPSDVGGCRRAVYYRETPPEDYSPEPENKGAAWMGGIIHEEVMRRRAALYPWRMYGDRRGNEVYLPGMTRPSKYDEFDPITGRLTSIKTAGTWRWNLVGEDGADEKWWDQDHLYAMCLIELGFPVSELEVLVIERADGKFESFVQPYDELRARRVLRQLQALVLSLELGVVPPRDGTGPNTDGICRNCPARRHCWQLTEAEALGRSGPSLVLLGRDPDRDAVEQLAGRLVAKRKEKTTAEKEETVLKDLLEGVRGVFGEYEAVPGTSSHKRWAAWQERVKAWWNADPEHRPAELPEPELGTTSYVSWKPLRKATRERIAKEQREAAELEQRERAQEAAEAEAAARDRAADLAELEAAAVSA